MYANTPSGSSNYRVSRAGIPAPSVESCAISEPSRSKCISDEPFVGLAISGGGSRAANYSAAVMSELDRIGILKHVSAISSVSGGSLAAAYYATRSNSSLRQQDEKLFWETAKANLSKDFRSAFVAKLLRPDNFMKTMFGPVGRTDLMAQVFDEHIFAGMKYGDLENNGPGLIINATALNDLSGLLDRTICTNRRHYAESIKWESVSFTDEFFDNCLHSAISSYPISHAVAASAAFPGLFSSVPLARFEPDEKFETIIPAQYLHVMDGGPADNLGIDGILSDWAAKSRSPGDKDIKQCLIIVIDAFASGEADARNLKPDPRSVFDRFVDSNFFDSIDAMLNRRRLETLKGLHLYLPTPEIDRRFISDFPVKGHTFHFWDGIRVAKNINPLTVLGADAYRSAASREAACMFWYIAIDALRDLVAPDWEFLRDPDVPYRTNREDDEYEAVIAEFFSTGEARNRIALWDLASRIRTDFNLVGPKNCTSKTLSDVLWAAGRYSVNQDVESREKVCAWLEKAGMTVSEICAQPSSIATTAFPIKYIYHAKSGYSVECQQQ